MHCKSFPILYLVTGLLEVKKKFKRYTVGRYGEYWTARDNVEERWIVSASYKSKQVAIGCAKQWNEALEKWGKRETV